MAQTIPVQGKRTPEKTAKLPRLVMLLIALLGCVVVAVPMVFALAEPLPLTLIGCGLATFALALFLFFSV